MKRKYSDFFSSILLLTVMILLFVFVLSLLSGVWYCIGISSVAYVLALGGSHYYEISYDEPLPPE